MFYFKIIISEQIYEMFGFFKFYGVIIDKNGYIFKELKD